MGATKAARVREIAGVRMAEFLSDVPAEVSRLRRYGVDVAYDLETTDVDPINSRMVTVALKPKGKTATVIDVRGWSADDLRMLGSMLEPLFDGQVTIVGHNLKFDFEFALAQMKVGAHKAYDTMLAEQVIWGLGMSSGSGRGVGFGMDDVAKRYGIEVSKEERSWFIDLDKRTELSEGGAILDLWEEPLPVRQILYIRQDVSVVHKIKEAQQEAIGREMLWDVINLENRALFALVGIEVWGVTINRDGWLSVIDRVKEQQDQLERQLHMGSAAASPSPTLGLTGRKPDGTEGVEGEYDGLDIHILKVRNDRWNEKMRPYEEWVQTRDLFINTHHKEWDDGPGQTKGGVLFISGREEPFKMWADYKKYLLEWWYERHGKQSKPPALKSGINLGSWMQVRDGFNDLGIPVKGVSEEELEPYRGKHPLVGVAIDYGHARKLTTVYGREKGKKKRAFVDMLDAENRLRASYQQIGADTERMSSYDPNFQQIPADGLGAELRQNVVPAPGYTFVIADFSNIELRIVAELSGDPFLLAAFASGRDVHAYVAGIMFSLPEDQRTKEWTSSHDAVVGGRALVNTSFRKTAKTISFMLLYGGGTAKLAGMLGVSLTDAKTLQQLYYATFSTAIAWLNEQKSHLEAARKRGETRVAAETRAGWKRWFDIPKFPEHPAKGKPITVQQHEEWMEAQDEWRHQMASIKRQLANTPIQGLSAAITKLAAALWYERVGYDPDMKLVAIIHDEDIIEVLVEKAQQAASILKEVMYAAMREYLHVVDLGVIEPMITDHWEH